MFLFKISISNIFVTVDVSSSLRSYFSQNWQFLVHYCLFYRAKSVHNGFLWCSSFKFDFKIYLSWSKFLPYFDIMFHEIGCFFIIIFFKCTSGTELSVKTSRTAPNCTRTARPISTNFQSTLQWFHQKCTKCTKCTRGKGLSVKTCRTAPNQTRNWRSISTIFQSTL